MPLRSGTAIELNSLPHSRARALVTQGMPVYLFVNPVEYHGPHLPLHNDYLLSVAAAEDLHARLARKHLEWPLVFAAPLHLGVDPVPGHGSVPCSYSHVRRAVLGACAGLAALGAKRVIVMTFHGSPLHALALQEGVDALRARGIPAIAPFNLVLEKMLGYRSGDFEQALLPISDERMRLVISEQLADDFHAGFFETSLLLHYRPELVAPEYQSLPPCAQATGTFGFRLLAGIAGWLGRSRTAAELRFVAQATGWLKQEPFTGYTGWPHLANARSGAVFAEHIMALYLAAVQTGLEESVALPGPAMSWVRTLSLGGRLYK